MGATLNFTKKHGRSSFRSPKRYNFSKSYNSHSNNKLRAKGSISNLYVKYIKLAKEASSAGDRIQAEYYNQFADHFSRIMIDDGIKPSENKNINEERTSMEINELKLFIKLKQFNKLFLAYSDRLIEKAIEFNNKLNLDKYLPNENTPNSKTHKILDLYLLADFILLNSEERKKFVTKKHFYLIEQIQKTSFLIPESCDQQS